MIVNRNNLLILTALLLAPLAAYAESSTLLAEGGKALQPVIIATNASAETKISATVLADYLGRMAATTFEIKTGDGASGIVVGRAEDFPGLKTDGRFETADATKREDYLLRSHTKGVWLIGATDLAVRHAVWDCLYRLGYRQFFPGKTWEVIPAQPRLVLTADVFEHPAYYSRRIWYGFGAWDYAEVPYRDWCEKNRAVQGIVLNTGHAYDGILSRNKAAFAAHPEYLGLVGGVRKSTKFCISNPSLRQLVVDDALKQFAANLSLQSVSMDPSDGGNWCECDACAKLGSVTDRAITLANETAAAVVAKYPGKLVGMYAYNYHSPPPNIRVHPAVVISVATAFITGGFTIDELLNGWSKQATILGIREYYSVNTWDRDLPGAARGGNLDYLKRTIPHFREKSAQFLSAEASDNWGPNGLGYYLASRMLWDVGEAAHTEQLVNDFLTRAFGPASEPMREFYRQLAGSQPHLVAADQLGRMFRALDQSRRLADSPEIGARLDDLVLYSRYVDLYRRYEQAKGIDRQQAFEALIRHAYRMRKTMMVHAKALYRDLVGRDKTITITAEAQWNVTEGKNPWKSSMPFTADELTRFIAEGIERNPVSKMDFKPVTFTDELINAAPLKLPEVPVGKFGTARGQQVFYTRVEHAPATIELEITGGLIAHYRNRGNVRVELWKLGGASQTGERETLAAQNRSTPPDGNPHIVTLSVGEPGLYRLTLNDGMDLTQVKWNSSLPWVIKSSNDEPMNTHYNLWQMYFYVPKGTKTIGLFGGGHGEVRDSANRPVFWLNGREPNFYSLPVPDGEDGKLWSIRYGRGAIRLLTVPPLFARSAAELLLPREVVEKDSRQ
jgi:hypothetical protein